MTTTPANVRVAITGAVFSGPTSTTAPTGTSGSPDAGLVDLGLITEDGVEIGLPGAGDSTSIRAWQNGQVVRVIRKPSEDSPSWKFAMMETSIAVIEEYFGVTVTSTTTEGSFQYTVENRDHKSYVIDAIDGAELLRDYVPYGVVTDVDSHKLANSDATVYGVTVEGDLDPVKGFNFERWSTALKTPA